MEENTYIGVYNSEYGHTRAFLTLDDYKDYVKRGGDDGDYNMWDDQAYIVEYGQCIDDGEYLTMLDIFQEIDFEEV